MRGALFAVACAASLLAHSPGRTDAAEATVPIELQGEILVKVAAYDKNFAARAGSTVHVLIVVKGGDASSENAAKRLQKALSNASTIAGLPHDEQTVAFSGAAQLAQTCKNKHAAIVYLSSGFDEDEVAAIGTAFVNVDVLSAGAMAGYVPKGMVLGFDLVQSKPKILANLSQARRQNVAFKADILKLMKVYE